MKIKKLLLAFNRGLIDAIGLARIDIERYAMSAAQMVNWVPRVLGSMMLRPGLEFIINGINPGGANNYTRVLPFIFEADDTALLLAGNDVIWPMVNEERIVILATTAVVTNSTFVSNITGWTDASEPGGSVSWLTGGYAGIRGDGTDFGILRQTVTINETGQEHTLSFFIEDGPVRVKVGSTAGDDDYVAETRLDRGDHHLSFTPTGNITIEMANERQFYVRVDTVWFFASGAGGSMSIIMPWGNSNDLHKLRWVQSGDIIYCAYDNIHLTKIERRGVRSWSVSDFLPEDGPFRVQNVSGVTISPSALNGDITLTASQGIFKQEHADNRSLFRIASNGQTVTKQINGADDWTDPIRVTGSENARIFQIIVEGTFTATVKLQFAFASDGPWNDQGQTWTAPVSTNYDDGQDGSIIYYRIGVDTGDYTTGTVTATLVYSNGSIEGVARVIGFTSATVVDAQVLSPFGETTASRDWWEGEWSDYRGWPSAIEIHEGRLWLAGNDKIWGSVSDQYESFSDVVEGDAGSISRVIGFGPIRVINWLLGLGRMLIGTTDTSANVKAEKMDGNAPISARSSNFDEPLTPFNFHLKTAGSRGIFVDRTEQRLYELVYDINNNDYRALDLSVFTPSINQVGIRRIAVQMKPDIRVHCVRNDGTVGMMVYDRLENVICWCEITSPGASGLVEDVAVLPGVVEDKVYYVVQRTINGLLQRHVCRWALESEAQGGQINKIADSAVHYSGAATTAPFTTELLHLRDETVEIWADGIYVGTDTVTAAGALTNPLATAASEVVVGLGYTARFQSVKLGELENIGLLDRKKVNRIGFIAKWLHHLGLRYGPDFTNMRNLPQVENGKPVVTDTVWGDYHEDDFAFGGDWDTDSRICLEAQAPKPATLLALITEMESVETQKR